MANIIKEFIGGLVPSISLRVERGTDSVIDKVEVRAVEIQRRMLRILAAFTLLLIGGLFVTIAAYFFLVETLGVNRGAVFLTLGALLLVLGYIFQYKSNEVHDGKNK